jgi:hypothetical protein
MISQVQKKYIKNFLALARNWNEKYYKQYMKIHLDFIKKNIELIAAKNNDPEVQEREYVVMLSILPLKALYNF